MKTFGCTYLPINSLKEDAYSLLLHRTYSQLTVTITSLSALVVKLLLTLWSLQQTGSSTKHKKSSRADDDTLISDMLGGASSQPPVSDSGWDEDFFAPKVW